MMRLLSNLRAALLPALLPAALLLTATPSLHAQNTPAAAPLKTLRYAFLIAETTFDPAQISDLYSRTVAAGMFDGLLEFEFLARPFRMRPTPPWPCPK